MRPITTTGMAMMTCAALQAAGAGITPAYSNDRAVGRPLFGVIYWGMYSGATWPTQTQEFKFLKPEEHQWRAPFFARRTGIPENPLYYNPASDPAVIQDNTDQEILYASSAGIDYFAFGYEPPHQTFYLRPQLDAFLQSRYRNEIQFCIYMTPSSTGQKRVWEPPDTPYTADGLRECWGKTVADVARLVQFPNYQRVLDGRPLVYMHNLRGLEQRAAATGEPSCQLAEFMTRLREAVKAACGADPYLTAQSDAGDVRRYVQEGLIDATHPYHYREASPVDAPREYAELIDSIFTNYLPTVEDIPVIPPMMSGADWMPRVPVMPQVFPAWHWQEPKRGDIAEHVNRILDFVAENPGHCPANTALMYAWNEHSEGGHLCPIIGKPPEYKADTWRLDEVSAALKNWRPPAERRTSGNVLANFTFGDRMGSLESVAQQPEVEVSQMVLPQYAYFDRAGLMPTGRAGIAVNYHVRNNAEDAFRFTVGAATPVAAFTLKQLTFRAKTTLPISVTAEIATATAKEEQTCTVPGSEAGMAKVIVSFDGVPLTGSEPAEITIRITGTTGTLVTLDNVAITGLPDTP